MIRYVRRNLAFLMWCRSLNIPASAVRVSLLLVGALLPFAFAPFHLWPLAILCPAFLLWVWQNKLRSPTPVHAFWSGVLFGLGMYGVGISWVFVSIHRYGNTDVPLAIVITGLPVIGYAFLLGVQGYLLKRIFKGTLVSLCLLGFPCLWMVFEWVRSTLLSGFPWLFVGNTQLGTALSGYAPIGSVYTVSFMVIVSSGVLIAVLCGKSIARVGALVLCVVIWGTGEYLRQQEWTKGDGKIYTASLVQGNVAPFDKFTQADPIRAARMRYGHLTDKHWGSHLIVWPENAIAYPLPFVQPFLDELSIIAKTQGATLITGLQTLVNQQDYYNSMIALGSGSGLYHKRHLLPFGEFLPFDRVLRGLIGFFDIPMSNFVPGPAEQAMLKTDAIKIMPLICYEVAFPELVRESVQDAHIIVTVSEDGWFGDSWGPHQHLEITQMRALETGRPILRATTCGISAFINAKGELTATAAQFKPLVLTSTFQTVTGTTPWIRIGLWPFLASAIVGFILPGRFRRRRDHSTPQRGQPLFSG